LHHCSKSVFKAYNNLVDLVLSLEQKMTCHNEVNRICANAKIIKLKML